MLHRLLLLAAGVVIATVTLVAQEWTPAGSRNGVELSFRDDTALDAREMRAIAELPHDAARIAAIVCDFTQTLDPDVRESKIISGDLQGDYVIYLRYSPRYMVVAARDVVISVSRRSNGCSWSEAREPVPERSGTVRMPLLRGSWLVEPVQDNRSRVVYQIAVKPGGRIPGWMVRRGAASALPDVIERVRRCLSKAASPGERC
jgi:hypothetical protein